ncbi:MAG: hypothetical protein QXU54_02135 [Candidatus Micrarchaeia archaeon]
MAVEESDYTHLINAIRNSNLSVEDKVRIASLIERVYTEYSIAASGIATLVGLTAGEKEKAMLSGVLERAVARAEEGKPALTPADRKLLAELLSSLRPESAAKIISRIENGAPEFLAILKSKISEKQNIAEEAGKLAKFLDSQNKKQAA